MRSFYLIILIFLLQKPAEAQRIDSIMFNLYTDSLKKGFFNYINVEGKIDGTWLPLDTSHIILKSNTGYFLGNDLFIDSSYSGKTVIVKTALKANPAFIKEIVIYIRKRGFDEILKEEESYY